MSIMNPELWLPEAGLSQFDCIQAADTMARFLLLTLADGQDVNNEIVGSFIVASMLSCNPDDLEHNMRIDFERAGLDSDRAAQLASQMSDDDLVEWATSCRFITEDKPEYGLRKTTTGTYVNEKRFVRSILLLRQTG